MLKINFYRYSDQKIYFATVAALDPRFKSLPFSSEEEQLEVFSNIVNEAVFRGSQVMVSCLKNTI